MMKCRTCRFIEAGPEPVADDQGNMPPQFGWCHRHPPTIIAVSDAGSRSMHTPVRLDFGWCGDYEPVLLHAAPAVNRR